MGRVGLLGRFLFLILTFAVLRSDRPSLGLPPKELRKPHRSALVTYRQRVL